VTAPTASCRVPAAPVDLARVARHVAGAVRLDPGRSRLWWAAHTPDGPGTLAVERAGDDIGFTGWGPGGEWMVAQGPAVLGWCDDAEAFRPPAGVVAELWRRRRTPLTVGRTDRVFDAVLEAVLGQKVQTALAHRSLRRIVAAIGEPAPGPVELTMYPIPQRLAELSSASLHGFGVERKRADTLRRAAREAGRLEGAGRQGPDELDRRLRALPGIGPWTSALVRATALGDADAVPVGDFHIPNTVCWALAGEARGDDDRMLELLEPYRPHRGRVVALLEATVRAAPRFGPRLECLPVDHFERAGTRLRDRGPRGSAESARRRS